jgi:hypothetical protein
MKNILISVLFLIPLTVQAAEKGEKGVYERPGLFSVQIPEEGYKWVTAHEIEKNGVKANIYSCTKEKSPNGIFLTVEMRKADTEAARRDVLKTHFNALCEVFSKSHFTFQDTQKPQVDAPIPDRVDFQFKCQAPNGGVVVCNYCVTLFGRYVYLFQSTGPNCDDAKNRLEKVIKSFKELVPEEKKPVLAVEGATLEDPGLFSIESPEEGFLWKKQGTGESGKKKVHGYLCTHKDKKTVIVLEVFEDKADSDESRKKFAEEHYESLLGCLEAGRDFVMEKNAPVFEAPIADQATCSIVTKPRRRDMVFHQYMFVFNELTYLFEASGPENEDPKGLLDKTVKTLTELKN